jgi:hypothetical protein
MLMSLIVADMIYTGLHPLLNTPIPNGLDGEDGEEENDAEIEETQG